jgi:hypothetical protein
LKKNVAHKNERVFVLNTSRYIQNPIVHQVILVNHNAKDLNQSINKYRNKVRQVHYHGKLRDSLDFRTGFKKVVKVFAGTKEEIIRHAKMLREQKCYICPQYPVEKIEDISLITSMGIAVDLLYKIDCMEKAVILKILDLYLHHPSLDIPVEPFHSILVSKLKKTKLHLWSLHLMFPGGFFYVDDTGMTEEPEKLIKKDYLFLIDWKSYEFKRIKGKNQNSLKKYFEAIPKKHPGCVSCEHFHFCFSWGKYKKDTCSLWKAILDKLQYNAKKIKEMMPHGMGDL